jgi:Cu+-exporting ATPase
VRHVERAVAGIAGVASVDVNLVLSRASLTLNEGADRSATVAAVQQAVRSAGYEVPDDDGLSAQTMHGAGGPDATLESASPRRVIIAALCALPLLVVAMSHGALIKSPGTDGIVQAILATVGLVVVGGRYLRSAVHALAQRTADMNVLVSLGALASYGYSMVMLVGYLDGGAAHGAEHHPAMLHLYFEAGLTILFFVTLGKWLEARARHQVTAGVLALAAQLRGQALRIKRADGTAVAAPGEELSADALVPGDEIICRPGERIAADGTVIDGTSEVDESLLTGEAVPVAKDVGAAVYAGSLNQVGILTVRVARAAQASTVGRIAEAVIAAQREKSPIARLADRVSAVFVPVVVALAAATALVWGLFVGDWQQAMTHAVSVLVIACPCALGIATPAAVAVATSRAAALGLLFKNAGALEAAARVDTVVFDKTGTLTTGRRTLLQVMVVAALDEPRVVALAAGLEQGSEHTIAKAICDYAAAQKIAAVPSVQARTVVAGGGVRATIDGEPYALGNADMFGGTALPTERIAAQPLPPGASMVWLGRGAGANMTMLAAFVIGDEIGSDARAVCDELRRHGVAIVIASGDSAAATAWIAEQVGVSDPLRVFAECKPMAKAALIGRLKGEGHAVAMIGDGINDATALAAADLGIAVQHGTELAGAAADVRVLHGGLAAVPRVFGLARASMRVIVQNLWWAFGFNVVGITLAAGVFAPWTNWQLSPIFASVAMSASSVLVLTNSLRLRRWS